MHGIADNGDGTGQYSTNNLCSDEDDSDKNDNPQTSIVVGVVLFGGRLIVGVSNMMPLFRVYVVELILHVCVVIL